MITAKSSIFQFSPYDIETCLSESNFSESPPPAIASRSIAIAVFPSFTIASSQGPLTRFLLPFIGRIKPPSEDHAEAIERAADPPPRIFRIAPLGLIPICFTATTNPTPSVLVPDHSPSDLFN